ncbi:hypothetical protein IV38_GL002020 [Lactobacillus selangorensis]|uniref:Major facilitator superfamily (MFS) profile domain-containing protein n=1 Tax=Lactobacillus selangorensis TaxID=81857 RepID=A0A0R2FS43_9LACO|nr:hypothetical protein [Lactobacillus selangorensis]KRN27565.1 hypothetical protein IV38_GL002020 [Lactobacillus selangorensis]KRN30162.1 hypothetical protein IV40_GL002008 [Lactobacillus selangorensis]
MAWGFVAFALSFAFILFTNNPITHVIGNMFSGVGIVLINATIPFDLSNLANKTQFPLVIAMNTLVSGIAGFFAPMLIAAVGIGAGAQSFMAGIVLSGVVAVLMFVLRIGNQLENKTQSKSVKA